MNPGFASTPEPPYVAVIFTSRMNADNGGYADMAAEMVALAKDQPGFLGVESVRNNEGVGITVSYWRDEESVRAWKAVDRHRTAQAAGRAKWYEHYEVRIAKVTRAYAGP
jgi:heme-degrading monooxygenase HmoA